MRGFRTFIVSSLSVIIVVALAIFAVQNLQGVSAHFLGTTFTPNLWWISIGSAVLGFLLALLILAPGRIATGWRARALSREQMRREQEMSILRQEHESLRAQHAHLQAEREGLQTERNQLRARLAAANEVPVSSASTALPADAPAASMNTASVNSASMNAAGVTDGGNGERYTPTVQPGGNEVVAEPATRPETAVPTSPRTDTAVPAYEQQQLGVGGRLRSLLNREREGTAPDGQDWTTDQPPAPTA